MPFMIILNGSALALAVGWRYGGVAANVESAGFGLKAGMLAPKRGRTGVNR
jgi:hypothetical protein